MVPVWVCAWAGPLWQNAGATEPLAQGLAGFDENYAETSVPEKRGYVCVRIHVCVRVCVCAHTCVYVCVRVDGTCVHVHACQWVRVFALQVHLMSAPDVCT